MLLFLPSPAHGVYYLGPVPIRGYALSILLGIIVAVVIARHRWKKWGEEVDKLENLLLISIIMGIIGARVYWVVIEWHRYFGANHTEPWYHMFYVWEGGLGIWGGILFGFGTGWLLCRRYDIPFLRLADCVAPAFIIAQGFGRLGNWWNQELYGYPTTLPWALEIDPAHRVAGYEQYATFHPTFLYEMLWDFAGFGLLLLLEKKLKLGRGKLFASYIIIYATGRFLVELLRIDPVDSYFGLRVNSWATLLGLLFGVGLLIWLSLNRPGPNLTATRVDDQDDDGPSDQDDEDSSDPDDAPATTAKLAASDQSGADTGPATETDDRSGLS
ncbi:MAG: prolipoprotein diacylglyceryl transferase [Propionibacteriaceae bacterium]|jgi:prolipoprotein diacylglyceryl transferase|nr:prolipoprotein diacylglyceryl transferase [Propionibacteriaceae bacterium]